MSDSEDSTVTYTEAPPSLDYVPGPEEPEQAPPLPEFVPEPVYPEFMPLEDEILLAEKQPLPAADSSTADSPRDILESNPEEDPVDYPADEGDDDDDESSDDDEDDDDFEEDEDEDEEEEEHPASSDSIPPPPVHLSPPLPVSSPPLPTSPTYPLGYCADILEVTLPPQKRLCITLGPRYEDDEIRREPERKVGYRIPDTWDKMLVGMPGAPATDETELGRRMIEFATTVRQDTNEIYGRLDDAQDDRALISGWVNMLYRDRRDHA
uniref:Reverse transcriptase domain-containing protein n=1 Tax=Tanacetum cinerariifolium TaxID=118510 RepID=A0A699K4W0_TANCI|nr:hypothetical protein [Tanacetum cinerariifolium]